jgi:hypothetical protein
MTALW